MPLFINPLARIAPASYSPIKAHLDDMINASIALEAQLKYVIEDGETYGLITYDTFFENCPEIIKNLERISSLLINSAQELSFDDEVFEMADSSGLVVVLYTFFSEHRRAIDVLATQHKTLKTTGPLYDSVGRCLDKERRALDRFRTALEERYFDIRERTEEDWTSFNSAMSAAAAVFPAPAPVTIAA